ncbi:ABC-2 transporter permease [Clostridium botulinum]|uniref:Putative membrane protein n=1 Tax=Clostridium botulinum (strain Langeland / NCTC 10281 / Type F) TaxID=441772 RepID=A7GHD6_CLOBL|nr:ABC-2 transporter permease [Clostridium botulinum]ABS41378.1 putative membrane protein [Clostridium botulinum F str. Langeland]ADG00572.1 putative membrane protein [Clostridium botulinum F str. 230613]KKM40928.1 membrane protein [Clostridium botulinum]MBY6792473.1 ABC-2 transporter permease [Clostridium botulinum]MBY6937885.1 ABC-2 transporter permease [Clostridium botulinum]
MLNLIRKDLIIVKSYIIKVLAILALYIFVFNNTDKQGIYILSIYLIGSMFISISFYYGEEAKENCILKSLPVKKKQVVLAKYASVILCFAVSLVLIYIINFIGYALNFKDIIQFPQFRTIFSSLSVLFISMAVQLPIHFKFDYGKVKLLDALIYFCGFSVIYDAYNNNNLNNYMKTYNFSNNIYEKFILISTIISIILFIISAILSMRIYEKKESM